MSPITMDDVEEVREIVNDSLIHKGLIWSPRRGQLDFTVPLFAEYLRDNHPLAAFES
jgi:hypothetical protein